MSQQRNLLTAGLSLTLRSWPAFVWTYVFNLVLAVFFSLPLKGQIDAITAHSFASQRLTGAFDLGVVAGVIAKLSHGPGPAIGGTYYSMPIYFLLYFLIVPGTLFCYQTAEPARLSTLLHSGLLHFWRFVRLTLFTLLIAGPVLGGLMALQNLWSAHVDEHAVGFHAFLLQNAGLLIVFLVASVLRLFFDLWQVYTVQLGLLAFPPVAGKKARPERQIRRSFKPAWRAFYRFFFRSWFTFLLLTVLGLAAIVLTGRLAFETLAQPRIWPFFLLTQLGLFLMLFTRFWQRGALSVLALDNPIPPPPEPVLPSPKPEFTAEEIDLIAGNEPAEQPAEPIEPAQEPAPEPAPHAESAPAEEPPPAAE